MDPSDTLRCLQLSGPGLPGCPVPPVQPRRAARVLLLEKNQDPGSKLLISGSGQCNITHAGEIRDFLAHYGDHGKFLKPALFSCTNNDLIAFFRERGLAMMTEENGKVFPETRQSADVLNILLDECRKNDVDLRCGEPVTGVSRIMRIFW